MTRPIPGWTGQVRCCPRPGITGVVFAIIEEPAMGWHAPVLASLLGGLVLTGLFVLRQRASAAPLIDLQLFRNRLFGWGTAAFAVISFAMTGVLFVLTPYLQSVQGNDAQGTGLRLLPMVGALIVAAAASERVGARIGVRRVIPAAMVLSAAGLLVLARATASGGYGIVALALVIFGSGLGLGLPLAADAVLGTLPPHQARHGHRSVPHPAKRRRRARHRHPRLRARQRLPECAHRQAGRPAAGRAQRGRRQHRRRPRRRRAPARLGRATARAGRRYRLRPRGRARNRHRRLPTCHGRDPLCDLPARKGDERTEA